MKKYIVIMTICLGAFFLYHSNIIPVCFQMTELSSICPDGTYVIMIKRSFFSSASLSDYNVYIIRKGSIFYERILNFTIQDDAYNFKISWSGSNADINFENSYHTIQAFKVVKQLDSITAGDVY